MRNLTPDHLRCPCGDCPSIHELEDGSGDLLIVGKWGEAVAVAYGIPVGHDEQAIVISRDLLAGIMCQADSTAACDPVSASPFQSGDGKEAARRLDRALCNFVNGALDSYLPTEWRNETERNFAELSAAYNEAYQAGLFPRSNSKSSDEEPALAGDTVLAASTEASLTPKTEDSNG